MATTQQIALAQMSIYPDTQIGVSARLHRDTGERVVAYMERHGLDSYALSQALYFPADDYDKGHIRRVVAILRRGMREKEG